MPDTRVWMNLAGLWKYAWAAWALLIPVLLSIPLTAVAQTVTTSAEAVVIIPDRNFRAVIEDSLGKLAGAPITAAEMAKLTSLTAQYKNISDLTGLECATNLTRLYLRGNAISDISHLMGLTELSYLELSDNAISDLVPLIKNTGLGRGDLIDVRGNPLNYPSLNTYNPTLTSRGVGIFCDKRTPATLAKVSGDNPHQEGQMGTALANPFVVEVKDGATPPALFEGVPVIFAVTTGSGSLSVTTATTDANGRAQTMLTLGPSAGINTVTASVTEITQGVTFTANGNDAVVNIPDIVLRGKIEAALDKSGGEAITRAEMATLDTLIAQPRRISDLTGLEYATNLTYLYLGGNNISDISALSGLTRLTVLWLQSNDVSDISGLSGSTSLTELYLGDNDISDISALLDLTRLTHLELYNNDVSDISGLSGSTSLTELYLGGNDISDISGLSGLTRLTGLHLGRNEISDISGLSGLTSLTWLELENNAISDISRLSGLTRLTELYLGDNEISDISALSGLTSLTTLWLYDNEISDISALSGLTSLTTLYLYGNEISDLAPLVTNTGLDSGDEVDVTGNPLSDTSLNTHIPALQRREVAVFFGASKPALSRKAVLDVDGDGKANALTDGALVAAYLFGIRGESLIAGRVSLDGTRTTAAQIEAYLAPLTESVLDVDGNGTANVFTDGALIISYLSGFRGRSLIAGRVSSNGTRTTVEAIEAYLQSIEHPPTMQFLQDEWHRPTPSVLRDRLLPEPPPSGTP